LGDLVGYGPQPNECIDLLANRHRLVAVPGNHDWGAIGKIPLTDFNPDANKACSWTAEQLSSSSQSFLEHLAPSVIVPKALLVHGSPRHPISEYLSNESLAQSNFDFFGTPLCFVGHTHIPTIFHAQDTTQTNKSPIATLTSETPYPLPKEKTIVNPGSVGQPRDGISAASYMVFDTETYSVTLFRTPYDISKTVAAIEQAGLPKSLSERLKYGW
tara:strand:- start:519 stop:1163 length:645 start_codon:yes stop_codon:yes gene_type:complete